MAAYVIVDVQVNDPEMYESYKKLTPATVEAFGGKFIVRGGQTEVLEGDRKLGRVVVLEFSDIEQAKAWWHSEMYTEAKVIRQKAAMTHMFIVEGV